MSSIGNTLNTFSPFILSKSQTFTVLTPTVVSILPLIGSTLGGTGVTITGTNFSGSPAVKIGGSNCTSVVVVNSTTLTAIAPAGTAGSANVSVGSGTLSNGFYYISEFREYNAANFSSQTWIDLSGNGRNVGPGSGVTGLVSSSGTVAYNGTTQFSLSADTDLLSQPYWRYCVLKFPGGITPYRWVISQGSGNYGVIRESGDGQSVDYYALYETLELGVMPSNTLVQLLFVVNGASSYGQLSSGGVPVYGTLGTAGPNGITIGAGNTAGVIYSPSQVSVSEYRDGEGVPSSSTINALMLNGKTIYEVS